jgi:hypothetical protein
MFLRQKNKRDHMRVIEALNRMTVMLAVAGCGLLLSGFLAIPLLGYGAATIAAVGTWFLALGGLSCALLLIFALLHRAATGQWYWGFAAHRAISRKGWLLVAVLALGVVIVAMLFDLDWFG